MSRARRHLRIAVATATALLCLAAIAPARAEGPLPPILPTGSPTPTPSPSPSAQPRRPSATPPAKRPPQQASRPARPRGPAPTAYSGAIADAIEYWRNLPKTPAHTTTVLLDLIARLQPPGAGLDTAAVVRGVGRFPVAGYTWYQDDWAAPRWVPYFHMHEGTDLFARSGTPVIACANGVVSKLMNGSIGGVSIWLRADDGTVYYYGHLHSYAAGLREGLRVKIGQVIATVGNSGTAVGTYPHVHFEVHPKGGVAVNPKPSLDAWLFEAEARAARALELNRAITAQARIGAAKWRTLFGLLAEPAAPVRTSWAWAAGGSGYADRVLDRIALEIAPPGDEPGAGFPGPAAAEQEHEHAALSPALIDAGILAAPQAGHRLVR